MRLTVELDEKDIEGIVREHLLKKYANVGEIKIIVGEVWEGHYTNERKVSKFKNVQCEVFENL